MTRTVFPAICDNRSRNEQIRIWVPGCASGEEVYSLAMMLAMAVLMWALLLRS